MTLILLSQDPELDSHLPLPGQGWLLQVSHLLPLQHSSNSPWQRLSKILLQHHRTKIISLRLQKPGSGRGLLPDYPKDDFCLSGQQLSHWGSSILPGRNAPRSLQTMGCPKPGVFICCPCLEPVVRTVEEKCQALAFIMITKFVREIRTGCFYVWLHKWHSPS